MVYGVPQSSIHMCDWTQHIEAWHHATLTGSYRIPNVLSGGGATRRGGIACPRLLTSQPFRLKNLRRDSRLLVPENAGSTS
jgi:hypothetical protein